MAKINNIYRVIFAAALALALAATGCSKESNASGGSDSGGGSGKGGSMARFTINGDYMYTVDNYNLKVVSLAFPDKPFEVHSKHIGFDVETIFLMDNYLFIGSQSAMYIYNVSVAEEPVEMSRTLHFKSCDPVVAYGKYAYVTLNTASGRWCGNSNNVLQVYDITNIERPLLQDYATKSLTSPKGLAVDGEAGMLFVCDGGLVIAYEIEETPNEVKKINLKRKYSTSDIIDARGMDAYDCIAIDGNLIVTGNDGIYQLGYDLDEFKFKSKIDLR